MKIDHRWTPTPSHPVEGVRLWQATNATSCLIEVDNYLPGYGWIDVDDGVSPMPTASRPRKPCEWMPTAEQIESLREFRDLVRSRRA